MGLNPGKKDHNLADMSAGTKTDYTPPSTAECRVDEFTFVIDEKLNGTYRMNHFESKIVDFALSLVHDEMTARDDKNIVRSDCDHSCVHRHAYRKDGTDILSGHQGKGVIPIPPAPDGYSIVDMHYDQEYGWVFDQPDEHCNRWRRS